MGAAFFVCPSRCKIHQYGIEHFGLISDNSNNVVAPSSFATEGALSCASPSTVESAIDEHQSPSVFFFHFVREVLTTITHHKPDTK